MRWQQTWGDYHERCAAPHGDFARCPGWRISWISPGLVFTAGKKPLETMQGLSDLSAGTGMKESLGELFVRCRFTISSHFRLCEFCSSYNAIRFMPKRVSNSVAVAVLRRFTGSSNPTRVKLRWDDHFLYVGAELRSRWKVYSQWNTFLSGKQQPDFVDFVDACWRFKTGQWLLVLLAIAMTYTVLFGQAQCCGGLEDRAQWHSAKNSCADRQQHILVALSVYCRYL